MLAQCFYQLEDFASLTKLVEVLTEGQPLLADIGKKLQSVGLCTEAVAAFTKVRSSDGHCYFGRVKPGAGAASNQRLDELLAGTACCVGCTPHTVHCV